MRILDNHNNRWLFAAALFAALATFLVFFPATGNEFVYLDDIGYIVENPHIITFDRQLVEWAFTGFVMANWHPLTMLSLALDYRIWGLSSFGFHLTNVVIHSLTVFCTCFLFARLLAIVYRGGVADVINPGTTGDDGSMPSESSRPEGVSADALLILGSCAGALMFGLHPLRVESVAWVSERKDVLCLFFMVGSIWWYLQYAAVQVNAAGKKNPITISYSMMLLLAALALLSKPVAVSLPLVFLILDWYPLGRLNSGRELMRLAVEKLPLIALAAITSVMTVNAQQVALNQALSVDAVSRLLVACKALLFYLWVSLWPAGLSPFYPHTGNVLTNAPGEYLFYAAAVGILIVIVSVASRRSRLWPALSLFYLVTLLPMLGVFQVGWQWAADRYSYFPALGLSLLWGGAGSWLIGRLRRHGRTVPALLLMTAMFAQLCLYGMITVRQIPQWKNTETVATRVIAAAPQWAGAVHYSRATYRDQTGNYAGALEDMEEAIHVATKAGLVQKMTELAMAKARILYHLGRLQEALDVAEWGLRSSLTAPSPENLKFHDDLVRELQYHGTSKSTPINSPWSAREASKLPR